MKTQEKENLELSQIGENVKFIDLFAGIGGFHLAFHNLGAECVFASEWDKYARETYFENFSKLSPALFKEPELGQLNRFAGDITKVDKQQIPDFDILTAGFPCQPFSQAGFKKGFDDTRGTLFFDIAEILKVKKPKAFFIENVRGLYKHDDGNTFKVIENTIGELGYSFQHFIVKASEYGLPQHRPRLFMVGFKDPSIVFNPPEKQKLKLTMSDVFQGKVDREIGFTIRVGGKSSGIDDRRNWDCYRVDGEVKTINIEQGKKMMGFPDEFIFPVSNTQAMKQLGNSVAVDAIAAFAKQMLVALKSS